MTKNEWKKWVGGMGRMVLAFAFILFSQSVWAGQNQNTRDKADSLQKAAAPQTGAKQPSATTNAKAQAEEVQGEPSQAAVGEEKLSRDGSHTGIKVHGHWTIEVRNPDGKLVTHREFENSYFPQSTLLPTVLTRANSVGFWVVGLNSGTPPCGTSSSLVECGIRETGWPLAVNSAYEFKTLTVTQSSGTIILSGTILAPLTGSISYVETDAYQCPNTTAPSAPCSPGAITVFTTFTFPSGMPPVNVAAGQTIAVTVNISFS
jgi:hypothetical protein